MLLAGGAAATLGMAALYADAEAAGFNAKSHRMPSEALYVETDGGLHRLMERLLRGRFHRAATTRQFSEQAPTAKE